MTHFRLGLGILLLGGCAAVGAARPPDESEVQALEQAVDRDSSNLRASLALAGAYRLLDRPQAMRPLLERTSVRHPNDAETIALLGLTYEDLGLLAEAADQYDRYLRVGQNPVLRRHLSDRLLLVRRAQLTAAARNALAREAQLAATPPAQGTVAVFPFLPQLQDTTLRPLGTALADLLITDLSQTNRLTLVERLRVQSLLDEMALAQTGLVDPATAARSGRLLGAGQIVQGSLAGTEQQIALRAAVVGIGAGVAQPLEENDALEQLFEMENRLALEIYRSLGIELTAAERARVTRRPTDNVRALLAYGFGLQAEDVPDFPLALQFFTQALTLDPDFVAAREHAALARRAIRAAGTSTETLAALAGEEEEFGGFAAAGSMIPASVGRDPASETLGREGFGARGAVIRIVLPQ